MTVTKEMIEEYARIRVEAALCVIADDEPSERRRIEFSEAIDKAEAVIDAALSAAPQAVVKPLEWRNIYQDDPLLREDWRADAHPIVRQYRVLRAYWGKEDKWGYCCAESDEVWFHTAEAAQAAAQADYESRILSALTTPPAQAVGVPEGWKLVPVEPTEAMLNVFHEEVHILCDPAEHAATILNDRNVWTAMLAASPTPPADDLKAENERLRELNERLYARLHHDEETINSLETRAIAAEAREKTLREALEMSDCPSPIIADDHTVKACVSSGQCGCINRAALKGGE